MTERERSGEPVPLAERIWGDFNIDGLTAFSVSQNGVLAYRGTGTTSTRLVWFDRAGQQVGVVGSPGSYAEPALSPDGKRLAVQSGSDIWLIDLATHVSSRFTFGSASSATWSPNGKRMVFFSTRQGAAHLYQRLLSQTGDEESVLKSSVSKYPTDWSADGRFLVYQTPDPKTRGDLWVLPMEGDRKPVPFLHTSFDEIQGHFSPNGRWMAYASDESGEYQIYVTGFPSRNGKWLVSDHGGGEPSWRRDGKELFYLAADHKLMAVAVKSDSAGFEAGAAVPLFQAHIQGLITDMRNYYVATADGKRFLFVTPIEEDRPAPINVVLNWAAGLKR